MGLIIIVFVLLAETVISHMTRFNCRYFCEIDFMSNFILKFLLLVAATVIIFIYRVLRKFEDIEIFFITS